MNVGQDSTTAGPDESEGTGTAEAMETAEALMEDITEEPAT